MTPENSGGPADGEGQDDGAARDRATAARTFTRAVSAYAQGEFAATVGYLRLLDRDGARLPGHLAAAHAALHGTLAARARNWDRCCDWYLRSLEPRDSHFPLADGELCGIRACGWFASARCGQCGLGSCAAHGVRAEYGEHRCAACLNGVLTNLSHAAVLAGRTEEAVGVLRSWARPGDRSVAKDLLRSLAPEVETEAEEEVGAGEETGAREETGAGEETEAGEEAEASEGRAARASGAAPQFLSRQHALAFALRQALGRGGLPEWERIGRLTAGSGTERVTELYRQAAAGAARLLTGEGRHVQAWDAWRRLWQTRPFDLEVAHGLGIAAVRLLTSGEPLTEGLRRETTRQTMACWSAVLHSPAHRHALQRACGEVFDDAVWGASFESLRTRLTQLFQDQDRAAGHTPVRSLALRWKVECEAASRWAGLPAALAPAPPAPAFFCGPLYLDAVAALGAHWVRRVREVRASIPLEGPFAAWEGATAARGGPTAARVGSSAAQTGAAARGAPSLAELFGGEAALVMLLGEGRWQEVISAVEETRPLWRARAGHGDNRPPAVKILATAFARRAEEYARGNRWTEALRDFEQAKEAGQDVTPYADLICRAAVGAGATVKGQVKAGYTQIGLLERGLQLAPDNPELLRNLTAVSLMLAERAEKSGRRDEAEQRYRRACELSPGDRQAAEGLARVRQASAARGGSASEGPAGARPASGGPARPRPAPGAAAPAPQTPGGQTPGGQGRAGQDPGEQNRAGQGPGGQGRSRQKPTQAQRLIAGILYSDALRTAREGPRDQALSLMREAATYVEGLADERFAGESPESDIARGLVRDARSRYDRFDEESTRAYAETLWLSRSYRQLAENSELPEVLAHLAGHLLKRGAYRDVIVLGARCTGTEGNLASFHLLLADAFNLRSLARLKSGDTAGAHKDLMAARKLRNRVPPVQGKLFEDESPEGS
ncbi:hypothetical protein [Streptomyces sp. NPDC058657]|uniref:hypothetical protein n=1 Tax=unclassified Streptomyces TaxID=2593676 RepID=UPI00365790EF